jgi:hypothetical protein
LGATAGLLSRGSRAFGSTAHGIRMCGLIPGNVLFLSTSAHACSVSGVVTNLVRYVLLETHMLAAAAT